MPDDPVPVADAILAAPIARVDQDWAIISEAAVPSPARFIRQMAVFIRNPDGHGAGTTNGTTTS